MGKGAGLPALHAPEGLALRALHPALLLPLRELRAGGRRLPARLQRGRRDQARRRVLPALPGKIADAVSAGRPGARRDTLEIYIKRLKKLEEIANSYEGIKQSFAVQAGREVRVVVQPDVFDDAAAAKLARDIVKRIEDELEYPGQIRVTVVREARVTEIAK